MPKSEAKQLFGASNVNRHVFPEAERATIIKFVTSNLANVTGIDVNLLLFDSTLEHHECCKAYEYINQNCTAITLADTDGAQSRDHGIPLEDLDIGEERVYLFYLDRATKHLNTASGDLLSANHADSYTHKSKNPRKDPYYICIKAISPHTGEPLPNPKEKGLRRLKNPYRLKQISFPPISGSN